MRITEISKSNAIISQYLISSRLLYESLHVPIGNLDLTEDSSGACLPFTPRVFFQAYENVMHGGMTTMILDSVAGVFGLYHASLEEKIILTSKMETIFIRKIRINEPCDIVTVFQNREGDKLFISASIFQKDETDELKVAVTAEFKFRIA